MRVALALKLWYHGVPEIECNTRFVEVYQG